MAVTLQDVEKAVQQLQAKNGKVSVREVRKLLGTGSMATISAFLRELSAVESQALNDPKLAEIREDSKGCDASGLVTVVEKVLSLSEALKDSTQTQLDQSLAFNKSQQIQGEALRDALVKSKTYEKLIEELSKSLTRTESHYLSLNERMANLLASTQKHAEDIKRMYEEKLKVVEQRESLLISQMQRLTAENARLQLKLQNLNPFPGEDTAA